MAALLSRLRWMGSSFGLKPSSVSSLSKWTASLAASEAATISASHEDRAIDCCLLEPQEMAARDMVNTKPDVEWRTAQSASAMPDKGLSEQS